MQAQMEAQGLTPYRLERLVGLSARVIRRVLAGVDVRASHWLQLFWALNLPCEYLEGALPPRLDLSVEWGKRITTEDQIVDFLRLHRGSYNGTVSDLARSIGRSVSQTYRSLYRLTKQGRIRWEKPYSSVYTFSLLPEAKDDREENPKAKV